MTEYTKKVVVGGTIVFVFTVLAALFGYLTRLVIARSLTAVEYGLIYSIFATFGLFSILQHMGMNEALEKYIAEFRVHRELKKIKTAIIFTVSFQLLTAFVLAATFWLLAPYLAEHYFRNSLAIAGIRYTAVFVFLAPIENLFLSIFKGYQKPFWYSIANFSRMIFIFLSTIVLLQFSKTILSPIISYILVYILSFAIYLPYFLARIFPGFTATRFEKFKPIAKKLFYFGAPVIITSFAAVVITYTDTIMITYFKTLKDVAIYNAAIPTAGLLWFFGSSLAIVLLPLSSEIWKRRHSQVMEEGIPMIYKYSTLIVIPFVILMFVFPDLILRILFGPEYSAGANVLKILSVAALFFTLGQINMSILSGMGKPIKNAKITAIAAVFNVIGNGFLIPFIGISGAAVSTAVSFAIIGILGTFQLKKFISFKLPIFSWTKTAVCAAIFLFVVLAMKNILNFGFLPKIIISVLLGFLAYAFLIFATKTVTINDIRTIRQRIK